MKLIELLNKIANNEIEPPLYFKINTLGHNFILKYLYFRFVIEDVKSSFNKSLFKNGENFDFILSSLNKTIEILDKVGVDKE